MNLVVRPATPADRAAVLALNVEAEALMSPMDHARLLALEAQSVYHRIVHDGQAAIAFLLAFDERADYDSPNYLWYRQRYPRFVYIDRIAVAASHRNRRIGGLLYDDVFAFARERGVGTVAAEFYIEPFNEASSRFHARYGFGEVGTQWVAQGRKRVSLQIASVSRD
ncbi:GNAT family N-acetyltransferase [Lysobacter enzymogenes]|uniref:GNAT family N-acetyltransferase n=1 Tax=Lysobacter enzymogenes TaxID=69 RepID=A0A3N2RN93_LYSEN|nr:GNAT family N-acetyltransferase [Lysobacter enzymogenes]ROU08925.1 GNAT family N-acetyltransferase [Lysobacter enzymogenes]